MADWPLSSPEGQLDDLVNAVLNDCANAEEWSTLSTLIANNPQACDYFTTQVSLHVKLRQVYAKVPADMLAPSKVIPRHEAAIPTPGAVARGRGPVGNKRAVLLTLALAVVVLGAFTIWPPDVPLKHLASITPAATPIADIHFIVETDVLTDASPVKQVYTGERIVLESRMAEVHFVNGIQMRLAAFSDVTFEGSMNCVLHRGRAFVTVPEGISGFRIRGADVQITDYGTEFGVSINEDNVAEVAVVKGRVGVRPEQSSTETQLQTGQGVTIEAGVLKRLYFVTDGSFPSSRSRSDSPPLIIDVRDNLRDIDSLNYYRVAPGGFGEDARIYVDRPHEFNGLTNAGLPKYLLGADYLMTFNDDKRQNLLLSVTLSQPADLYILFDDRIEVPAWLARDFQQLPDYVGIDEQTVSTGPERLGVGPGVSVDKRLSIWKKVIKTSGTVELGPVGAPTGYSLMYSVVAVPHRVEVVERITQTPSATVPKRPEATDGCER